MDAPKGFAKENTDAFLFRNTSQYIIVSLACFASYLFFKTLQQICTSKKNKKKNNNDNNKNHNN